MKRVCVGRGLLQVKERIGETAGSESAESTRQPSGQPIRGSRTRSRGLRSPDACAPLQSPQGSHRLTPWQHSAAAPCFDLILTAPESSHILSSCEPARVRSCHVLC